MKKNQSILFLKVAQFHLYALIYIHTRKQQCLHKYTFNVFIFAVWKFATLIFTKAAFILIRKLQSWIFYIWSFRNHSNMLIWWSKKHLLLLLLMLKTVALLNRTVVCVCVCVCACVCVCIIYIYIYTFVHLKFKSETFRWRVVSHPLWKPNGQKKHVKIIVFSKLLSFILPAKPSETYHEYSWYAQPYMPINHLFIYF